MPALEDNFTANRGSFLLVVQLIRPEVQRGQQRGDVRVVPYQQGDFGAFARSVTSALSMYFTSGLATFCATSVDVNSES